MKDKEVRKERITVRFTKEEISKLDDLEKYLELNTRSNVIRYLINATHKKIG